MMLKEGAIVDPANRERIARLLRFASSHSEDSEARTVARRVRRADAGGPEADLLPGRARPRLDPQEPEPGDLPPPRAGSPLSSPSRSTSS